MIVGFPGNIYLEGQLHIYIPRRPTARDPREGGVGRTFGQSRWQGRAEVTLFYTHARHFNIFHPGRRDGAVHNGEFSASLP